MTIGKDTKIKVVGVYPICNWGGIEVIDIDYGVDDIIIYRYNFGTPERPRKAKVYHNTKGSFFKPRKGGRVYLHEIMKVM